MTRPIGGASSGPSRVKKQETPEATQKAPAQESAEAPAKKTKKNTVASEAQYDSAFDAKPKPAAGGTAGATASAKAAPTPAAPKLSEATRKVLEQQLALHPKDSAAQKTLNALAASPGFTGLKEAEQQKLLRYVGGTNTDVSTPARGVLETLLNKDAFKKASAGKQTEQLRTFLTEQPGSPGVVGTPKDTFKDKRLPYKLHGPNDVKSHDFRGGKADAV